ncbi:MAG: Lrp/AsnC family transcriptional regulator [Promethearchaeota archaeon]
MTIKALIFCQVEHQAMTKVIEEFNKIFEIKKVFSLTGDYDMLAEIEVESSEDLYDVFSKKIDVIDGIIKTNTHVIMKSWEK